ncbi:NucA/NucB deoxyribonuclease domain-containing protein [Streptomyces sp. NPDC018036]|uniref:NucA/NucB deoxyribonuclease domain-containing protein n=1 Tax=Streptomyces sp. NPDC018036 TaxID=3365035 RepID=UPI003789472C
MKRLLATAAVTLGLLGSCLSSAQAEDDFGATPDTSLTTGVGVASTDPVTDDPSPAPDDTDSDPETAPSAEDIALGIEGTVHNPAAAPATSEDGQSIGLETDPQAACDDQVKSAVQTPDAQYAACASPLEPAGEISSEERAALSRGDAPADTSATESAVLAAVPDAGQADQAASLQEATDDSTPTSAPGDGSDASAAARSPWKEPKWCRDEGVDMTWYIERLRGCGIWRAEVSAIDVRTGSRIGGIRYLVIGYSFSARDSKTWAYQTQMLEVSRWGRAVTGTKVYGSASCTGKCKVTHKDFPAQAINSRAEPYGQFFMSTTINTAAAKQRGTGRSIASWRFSNPEWVAPSDATKLSTVDVRCDNDMPGAPRQVGCVNTQAVPVISYSLTGPWPELAKHIKDAQATGLPGKYGTTNYLTRLTNGSKITENRRKACPSSLPRPSGKSCDEYPFASTWQGARYSGGPFSRRMINATQNTDAGRALNGFYTYSRVLDGDRFLVWIR